MMDEIWSENFKQKRRRDRDPIAECNKSRKDPGLASLFAGDFLGMIPEPTGTTAVATNPGYAKLFAELGAGSLVVGIALVALIPFLRKLITDKAETIPIEPATVVPVA
jgi:POT family proton-dependent oligopeptide transporter